VLNRPFCTGEPGRWHVREQMRIESQGEATVHYWRCPSCHSRVELWDQEPIESELAMRDQFAIVISGESADKLLAGWLGPFELHATRDVTRHRTLNLELRSRA